MTQRLHPSLIRDSDVGTAFKLLMRTLPYAMARFCVLLASATLCLVWLAVACGGGWWIGNHVSTAFGVGWSLVWLMGGGFVWGMALRYFLHLIACGHVAVLVRLMTHGSIGDAQESQFSFGRRFVLTHFGEVSALFALNQLIGGVLDAVHKTLDTLSEILPIPGLTTVASVLNMVLGAATRYLDKVILSYCLACDAGSSWQNAQDGVIYYAQNARTILKTSVWIVIAERFLSALLLLTTFAAAAGVVTLLPSSYREVESVIVLGIAIMLAIALRAAFLKPLFLIVLMLRFHLVIEGQPLNQQWSANLNRLFDGWGAATRTAFKKPEESRGN